MASSCVTWPDKPVVSVVYRPWHQLDVITLPGALRQSQLCRPECWTNRSVDELALLYDSELSSLLDFMVPVATVTCHRRPSDPCFDEECRLKKCATFSA